MRSFIRQLIDIAFERTSEVLRTGEIDFESWETVRLNRRTHGDERTTYQDHMNRYMRKDLVPSKAELDALLHCIYRSLDSLPLSSNHSNDHILTYVLPDCEEAGSSAQGESQEPSDNSVAVNSEHDQPGEREPSSEQSGVNETQDHILVDMERQFEAASYTCLNHNKDFVRRVIQFWNNIAVQLGQSWQQLPQRGLDFAMDYSRYLILGKPGVGKTSFINYAFSVHSESLDESRVLVVRIYLGNVTDSLSLRTRLYDKFLRLYRDRIFPENQDENEVFVINLHSTLAAELELHYPKMGKEQSLRIAEEYLQILQNLNAKAQTDSPIPWSSNDNPPHDGGLSVAQVEVLTQKLLGIIQRRDKLGLIVVFDGLDSVTIDYVRYAIFKRWMNEIDEVTNNKSQEYYRAVYIVTMRNYSYIKLHSMLLAGGPAAVPFRICTVAQQPLNRVLERRCCLAHSKISESGLGTTLQDVYNVRDNIERLLHWFFFESKAMESGFDSRTHVTDYLMALTGGNLRAALLFLQEVLLLAAHILGNRAATVLTEPQQSSVFKDEYSIMDPRLYRLLLYGSCTGNLYLNRISYATSGALEINQRNRAILPNIFNYRDRPQDDSLVPLTKILIKLRVVQYLITNGNSMIHDVLTWLHEDYGFDISSARFETREMIHNGIIDPVVAPDDRLCSVGKSLSYEIKLTDLGHHLFHRAIRRAIYYETVCDDTPVFSKVASRIEPVNRFDSYYNITEYLLTKSKAMIFFLVYLHLIDEYMESLSNNHRLTLLPFRNYVTPDVTNDMVSFIHGTLANRSERDVQDFSNEWYNIFDVPIENRKTWSPSRGES